MKIIEKKPTSYRVEFSSILAGQLFEYQNNIYIALSANDKVCFIGINNETVNDTTETEHFGLNLKTGEVEYFSYEEIVIPVDGTLTYERRWDNE